MLEFIAENYYVLLVIGVLLIFAIIGYMIDTLKSRSYQENVNTPDTYIPEEEVFIQKIESEETERTEEEKNVENLLEEYNIEQENKDSLI